MRESIEPLMGIYLDHAATTPLDPRVLSSMEPFLTSEFGNPSSIHASGQRARMALDLAREQVAEAIGAHPTEVVFTSGGTESDNAAIRGVIGAASSNRQHIVTSMIEHEAVLEACSRLEMLGTPVTYVPPNRDGIVAVETVADALSDETALVSIMTANNEIGTIQPVRVISALCKERGVAVHTDAVQSVGAIQVDVNDLGVDLLSISAHKFYGPKGVGALYIRTGTPWRAQQLGGGQERTRRSGTENVAGIVGMATAITLAKRQMSASLEKLTELREYLFHRLEVSLPGMHVNGSRALRLPGNVNVSVPGISGEALVMALDREGVMVSSGSACASGSTEPSHVLMSIGAPPEVANSALRITLGRETTRGDVEQAADAIISVTRRLQAPAPALASRG